MYAFILGIISVVFAGQFIKEELSKKKKKVAEKDAVIKTNKVQD